MTIEQFVAKYGTRTVPLMFMRLTEQVDIPEDAYYEALAMAQDLLAMLEWAAEGRGE